MKHLPKKQLTMHGPITFIKGGKVVVEILKPLAVGLGLSNNVLYDQLTKYDKCPAKNCFVMGSVHALISSAKHHRFY
ncbi:hypothetical protein DS901_06055 [Loktanella sp. D2R18]|nr:hypothetical protein DS901_06055 [Loktanella sp. D2R18]